MYQRFNHIRNIAIFTDLVEPSTYTSVDPVLLALIKQLNKRMHINAYSL